MAEIRLTSGHVVLVDEEDFDWLSEYRWYPYRRSGNPDPAYAQRSLKNEEGRYQGELMHRVIMGLPTGLHVDHINGDGLDNRRSNLRVATPHQNAVNSKARTGNFTSRYRGVCLCAGKTRWEATIYINHQRIRLGWFVSEVEAARAYDAKAREIFGEFARLNFPEVGEQAA